MVNFKISRPLISKIDEAMEAWGFTTRAEFFRFCAIEFLRADAEIIASDDALREYSKSIQSVKSAKYLAKKRFLK